MAQIWIRRDRGNGKETEVSKERVIKVLKYTYANLAYAMQNCDKNAPLSSGWADYWPKEKGKKAKLDQAKGNFSVRILGANGTDETIQIDKKPTLEQMQKWVGGYIIEFKPWRKGFQLWVDEDGIPKQLPVNGKASGLVGETIYGTAVILEGFKFC